MCDVANENYFSFIQDRYVVLYLVEIKYLAKILIRIINEIRNAKCRNKRRERIYLVDF